MNAQAHLLSLGWLGPGHALDSRPPPPSSSGDGDGSTSTYKQKGHRGLAYDPMKVGNTGHGLVKPLGISQRKARLGIGKKSHEPSKGNEWWLKGFESALGNIGKEKEEREKEESLNSKVLMGRAGEKYGGLYGFFCKSVVMEGSIGQEFLPVRAPNGALSARTVNKGNSVVGSTIVSAAAKALTNGSKKRKSDAMDDDENDNSTSSSTDSPITRNSKSERKAAKRAKKDKRRNGLEVSPVRRPKETSKDFATVEMFMIERDKNAERKKKTESLSEIEQFAAIGNFFGEREAEKKQKKKKRKSEALLEEIENGDSVVGEAREETKEERRERRRKRREEKEQRLKEHAASDAISVSVQNGHEREEGRDENEAERKARRAERKRRKAEKVEKAARTAVEVR